jgi:hypothetical protein
LINYNDDVARPGPYSEMIGQVRDDIIYDINRPDPYSEMIGQVRDDIKGTANHAHVSDYKGTMIAQVRYESCAGEG